MRNSHHKVKAAHHMAMAKEERMIGDRHHKKADLHEKAAAHHEKLHGSEGGDVVGGENNMHRQTGGTDKGEGSEGNAFSFIS